MMDKGQQKAWQRQLFPLDATIPSLGSLTGSSISPISKRNGSALDEFLDNTKNQHTMLPEGSMMADFSHEALADCQSKAMQDIKASMELFWKQRETLRLQEEIRITAS
mmetsp:Transcript_1335/g.2567  ORF Transcript_1335/g.2567 Transcript_1335/m.2567 type:complete len:108 (-) Transcript_1335:223-546(-)